jgi:hypothetical protein
MKSCSWIGTVAGSEWVRRGFFVLLLIGFVAAIDGCTRAFYRDAADKEVNDILNEKDKYAQWKIEQYHVYPDPRSRFADPTNPDHPPMPVDDEAAYKLNPHPQAPGRAGVGMVWGTAYLEMVKAWDAQNREERAAEEEKAKKITGQDLVIGGPNDFRTGPIKGFFDEPFHAERAGFLLTLDQSVELGVINSPIYQNFREELYEAALPVTAARFSFAYQWAATENAVREWAGPLSAVGPDNSWSLGSNVGFTKLFSTGALLTLGFANNTVFNFTGPNHFISASTINLSMVQPLLAGGGRAVTLEPLTLSERTLLYGIRAYARFREQFYLNVAMGAPLPSDLASASGINTANPIATLAAVGLASTDVAGGFVSYLSTVYREVDMAVDKKWVYDLGTAIKLFEGLQEGGQVAPLQVDQVRSTLLQAQNTVLTDLQFFTNAVDQFKEVLGLPANLPLLLDDASCRAITRQLDRYYEVIGDSDQAYKLIEAQEKLEPDKLRAFLREQYTKNLLVQGTNFQKKLPASWEVWSKMKDNDITARLAKLRADRNELLDLKTDLGMKGQTLSAEQERTLESADFEYDVGSLEKDLRFYEGKPWENEKPEKRATVRTKAFRLVAYSAEIVGVWARNDRFNRVGELWPPLLGAPLDDLDLLTTDPDKAQEKAVQAALAARVDLMNARAQVVDAWRQIRVTANALMGVFNVGYNLEAQTNPVGTKPFAFGTPLTDNQLTLNFQLPLNRLAQRNAYRTALINYQVARRSLMTLEDNIAVSVRFDVRQLQLFAANYRIQKKVLQSLYSQVENALEVIVAPADPDNLKQTGTTGQANAAALTNQYLTALQSLNGAQTKMYDIWLSYQATRMQLYLDLERLPLDNRGVWIDEQGNAAAEPRPAGSNEPLGPPRPVNEPRPGDPPVFLPGPVGGSSLGKPIQGPDRSADPAQLVTPVRLLPPT